MIFIACKRLVAYRRPLSNEIKQPVFCAIFETDWSGCPRRVQVGRVSLSLMVVIAAVTLTVGVAGTDGFAAGGHPGATWPKITSSLPHTGDPQYAETSTQLRHEYKNRSVISPALGYNGKPNPRDITKVAAGTGVASFTESISSSFKQGFRAFSDWVAPKTSTERIEDPTALATKVEPKTETYVAVARMYEQTGRPAEAESQYRKALQLTPKHLGALLGYAHLKDHQGQFDEAIRVYQRAASEYPRDPTVFNDLGLCYARRGRYHEALGALGQAIRLQPKRLHYRNNVALVLVEMGQIDAAFSQLRVVHSEAVAHYNLGYLLQKKGSAEAAAWHFGAALSKDPSLSQARIWLNRLQESGVQLAGPQAMGGQLNKQRTAHPERHVADRRMTAAGQPPGVNGPSVPIRPRFEAQETRSVGPGMQKLPPVERRQQQGAWLPGEERTDSRPTGGLPVAPLPPQSQVPAQPSPNAPLRYPQIRSLPPVTPAPN